MDSPYNRNEVKRNKTNSPSSCVNQANVKKWILENETKISDEKCLDKTTNKRNVLNGVSISNCILWWNDEK